MNIEDLPKTKVRECLKAARRLFGPESVEAKSFEDELIRREVARRVRKELAARK